MKYRREIVYGMLRFFGDKQPHKYYEQHQLFVARYNKEVKKYKINVIKLMKYMVENEWISGCGGDDFYKTYFPFRYFILTDKGDKYFRHLQIIRDGNHNYYTNFNREEAKKSNKYI